MSPERRAAFHAFGRIFLQGAKSVGTRAAAHAVKSVAKDGRRIVRGVEKRFADLVDKLEEMTAVDVEEPDDDDR